MLIVYDPDRGLWDIRCGDVYFASTRTREQAEVLLEALDDGITTLMERSGAAPVSDCGAWDHGLFPAVDAFRSALVRQALQMAGGNKSQAARLLKIGRTTFLEICNRLEREREELIG